jgi:isovaleryl-CoA dehydrogenase
MKLLTTFKKYTFSNVNFYRIANFDSDLEELRQTVRRFADEKVAPLAHETDVKDAFPMHLWREFG